MTYILPEEHGLLRQTVRELADAKIAPAAADVDAAGRFPYEALDALTGAGLHAVHIPEYTEGTWTNHTPRRIRKLLLHRKEIDRLAREVAEQGLTLIPLSLYFRDGNVKVELGVARGKRTYDKRQDLAKRDAAREMDRALKRRRLRAGGSCPLRRTSAAATPGREACSRPGRAITAAGATAAPPM